MCVRRAKAALPAYHAQVAGAYSRRRISQGKALSQLEASPEFQNQQAEAKTLWNRLELKPRLYLAQIKFRLFLF
jgi:hypothetical protein